MTIIVGVPNLVTPSSVGIVTFIKGSPPPAPFVGNITTGISGGGAVGFQVNPAFGSTTNPNPNPPGGGTALFSVVQDTFLGWTIGFSPATVAQNAWTSVTLENGVDTPIVLLSAVATYTAFLFTTPFSSRWIFGATADLWLKLGSGANVAATFA